MVRCLGERNEVGLAADGSQTLYRVSCGHVYQIAVPAGGPWPVCDCGTFAVRSCQNCAAHLCGDCSTRQVTADRGPGRWSCRPCATAAERRSADARRAAREAEHARFVARYQALPALSVEDMIRHLRGEMHVQDGVTHQIWEWTNADLVAVLENIGVELPLHCSETAGGRVVLHRDGSRERVDVREWVGTHRIPATARLNDDQGFPSPTPRKEPDINPGTLTQVRRALARLAEERAAARPDRVGAAQEIVLFWVVPAVVLILVVVAIWVGVAGEG